MRVFVQPQAGFQARSVTARLELSNSSGTYPLQEASFTVTRASTESNGNSTFNFFVDGEVLDGTGSFRVSLYEAEGVTSQGGDISQATFPRGAGLGAFGEEPRADSASYWFRFSTTPTAQAAYQTPARPR